MFLEPDWYENCATLCLAQCISSAPNRPQLHCTTTQKGQSHPPSRLSQANCWAPCTSPPTATHPPITHLISIHQLTRSAPLPKPPRLQEPASQAQSHSLPTNGTLLDWHLQQWQQGAAQIMHRMHRARSCLPVPAKRPRAHACAWATLRKRTARLSDMLTPEAFLAQFTVEKRRDGLGKRGKVGRGSVRRAGFSGEDAGGWTRTRGRSMSLMDGMSLMRLCAAGPSNAWQ